MLTASVTIDIGMTRDNRNSIPENKAFKGGAKNRSLQKKYLREGPRV